MYFFKYCLLNLWVTFLSIPHAAAQLKGTFVRQIKQN